MKKLMIAAAIACTAAMVQASAVSWTTSGVQIDGDWESGVGNYASGFGIYFFDANGAYSQSKMIELVAAATTTDGYAAWLTAMDGKADYKVGDANGAAFGTDIAVAAKEGKVGGYIVVVDAEVAGDAKWAFVSNVYTADDLDPVSTPLYVSDIDQYDAYVNALDYSADPKTNWSAVGAAVPEPTSGLLLLLGVAGLALRRRRA